MTLREPTPSFPPATRSNAGPTTPALLRRASGVVVGAPQVDAFCRAKDTKELGRLLWVPLSRRLWAVRTLEVLPPCGGARCNLPSCGVGPVAVKLPLFSLLAKQSSPGTCSQNAEEAPSPARRQHPPLSEAKCASQQRELFIGCSAILTRPHQNWRTAPHKDSEGNQGPGTSPTSVLPPDGTTPPAQTPTAADPEDLGARRDVLITSILCEGSGTGRLPRGGGDR